MTMLFSQMLSLPEDDARSVWRFTAGQALAEKVAATPRQSQEKRRCNFWRGLSWQVNCQIGRWWQYCISNSPGCC